MGGKNASGQVVGYRYSMSLHMGLCRGPIDELVEVKVGDLEAWPVPDGTTQNVGDITTRDDLFGRGIADPRGTLANVVADSDPSLNGPYVKGTGLNWIHSAGYSTGEVTENASVLINAPSLFGGDQKEGGISGTLNVLMGGALQVATSLMQSLMGLPIPGFRGVTTLFFDGEVCAMNPYPKEWKFRIRRALKGWKDNEPWYPTKAIIYMADDTIRAMNPAHILYECSTNVEWGRGFAPEMIDENSFIVAANQLCGELFGLCFMWLRQTDISDFIQQVVDHIGAALYFDRETGLLTLRLLRDDYDHDDLPLYDYDSGLLEILDDDSGSQDAVPNEIIINYIDPITGDDASIRVQNLASFHSSGTIISTTKSYPGIPTADLAGRVGLRDLAAQAAGLKRYKLTLDRRAWRLAIGSVFAVSAPDRGIERVIVRIGEIALGTNKDGTITVTAVEDVFGLPDASFVSQQSSTWVTPPRGPVVSPHHLLLEATWRDLVMTLSPADLATVTADQTFVGALATRPAAVAHGYDLWTKTGGEDFVKRGAGSWVPNGTISADMGLYDTAIVLEAGQDLDEDMLGAAVLIGDEIMRVDFIDTGLGKMTVARGCVDTIPMTHATGDRAYFFDHDLASDFRAYAIGEDVHALELTRATGGTLAISDATEDSLTAANRQGRPYPPGNVLVDGNDLEDAGLAATHPTGFVLTWAHRDRLMEADHLVEHGAGDAGPEAGTTYTVRVIDPSGPTTLRTDAAATSPWTYDAAMILADGSPTDVVVELESVRDTYVSWQTYSIPIHLS